MLRCKMFLSLVLVIVSLGLIFSGCGTQANTPAQTTSAQQAAAAAQTTTTESPTKDFAKLKWYLLQEPQEDGPMVFEKANELIKDKINANVTFEFLPWASFDDKMKMIMSSGEEYDLAFTSSLINNYTSAVSKGAFLELDELIDKYGPAYKEIIPPVLWDGVKVNGKIYGLPNYQVVYVVDATVMLKSLIDKYNIDLSKLSKYEDMGQVFEVIKKNEPTVYPHVTPSYTSFADGMEQFDHSLPLMVDSNVKVSYLWDNPDFQARYNIHHEWSEKGYIPSDANLTANVYPNMAAGKVFSTYLTHKPGAEADFKKSFGQDNVFFDYGKPFMTVSMATAALTGISSTSRNPERAMMLMNLMMSDKIILNTMVNGIEGIHYKKTGDNSIELLDASKNYSMYAWELGNQFLSYTLPGQPDTVWQDTIKGNEEAEPSVLLGFNMDKDAIKTEVAAVQAVYTKYLPIMHTASMKLEDFADKMKKEYIDAGLEQLIIDVQKQIDNWKAESGK